jgi:hypothetical protein
MIEISEREYWKILNYHDGLLYCSMLEIDGKNDWRMISDTDNEELVNGRDYKSDDGDVLILNVAALAGKWYIEDVDEYDSDALTALYWVIPVRGELNGRDK